MTSVSLDRIASALGMTESKTPDTHIWATVSSINDDGSFQVQFNGAGTTTRAAKVCNAEAGDRVLCVVSNGQVSAIGRVGGEPIDTHDKIIAQGTSGIWTYRKWESGIAECWGIGTAAYANDHVYHYTSNYPFNFVSQPVSVASLDSNGNSYGELPNNVKTLVNNSSLTVWVHSYIGNAGLTTNVRFYVIGNWKQAEE